MRIIFIRIGSRMIFDQKLIDTQKKICLGGSMKCDTQAENLKSLNITLFSFKWNGSGNGIYIH